MKKYELTNEAIVFNKKILYRIKAIKNFGNVKQGDLGGFVESENNLSHFGSTWIHDNAKVYGNAQIYDYAQIYGNVKIYGNAQIHGDVEIFGRTEIGGEAQIT